MKGKKVPRLCCIICENAGDHKICYCFGERSKKRTLVRRRAEGPGRDVGEEKFGDIGRISPFKKIKAEHRPLVRTTSTYGQPVQRMKLRRDIKYPLAVG